MLKRLLAAGLLVTAVGCGEPHPQEPPRAPEPLPVGRPASFGQWMDHFYPDLAGRRAESWSAYEDKERQYRDYLQAWEMSARYKREEIAIERERLALERERLETERIRRESASGRKPE